MRAEPPRLEYHRWLQRALFLLGGIAIMSATAQHAEAATEADVGDGPLFSIDRFVVEYRDQHPDHPPLSEILPVVVELGIGETGLVAPRPGIPTRTISVGGPAWPTPLSFHASAIAAVDSRLLGAFHSAGLVGVFIAPDPEDIDDQTTRDLRPQGTTALRIQVWTGRVQTVRTVASGKRVDPDWQINNKVHRRIHRRSPIQPAGQGPDSATDLLRKDVLEDYLFKLNRHPGRYIEAALSPTTDGRGISLDYQVHEAKPWFVYAQTSNTGTEVTDTWQTRFGYVNRQLTDRDDILSIVYGTTGFKDIHNVYANYEAPWFGSERPRWARSKPSDPSWFKRDRIPWLGNDNLRWDAEFFWSRFRADEVDRTDDFVGQEFAGGLGLIYTAWQHRALFLDLTFGLDLRHISVLNATFFDDNLGSNVEGSGSELLVVPTVGIDLERVNEYSTLFARASWEANVNSVSDEVELLGRAKVDGRYHLVLWDVGFTHYLEPLLFRNAWSDPSSARTSTLAHELALGTRGQYGMDYRLIPQAAEVLGGLYTVRGYPQSEASGDSVYLASVEYRFHLPRVLPIRRKPFRLPFIGEFRLTPQQVYGRADWDLVLSGFFDVGRTVRNRKELVITETNNTMMGAGASLELRLGTYVRARVDWGHALKTTYFANGTVSTPKGHDEVYLLFSVLY